MDFFHFPEKESELSLLQPKSLSMSPRPHSESAYMAFCRQTEIHFAYTLSSQRQASLIWKHGAVLLWCYALTNGLSFLRPDYLESASLYTFRFSMLPVCLKARKKWLFLTSPPLLSSLIRRYQGNFWTTLTITYALWLTRAEARSMLCRTGRQSGNSATTSDSR